MRKIAYLLLAAVLCLGLFTGIAAASAEENLNLTEEFWSGEAADSDGYLKLETGGNECFFGVDYEVTGNYTLEYEFKDLSPWRKSGGEWRNINHGGEAWIVLGSKKMNGQWQGNVRGNGSGGVCIRVTDGSMESYDFVGGPYPFFNAAGEPIPANTSWTPAGTYAQLIDARLVYRFVVKADEGKIEIWAGFKDVTEPELQVKYRGHLIYGSSGLTDGSFMMMFYYDSLFDNFKVEKEGQTVYSLDFNDGVVPEEIASSLPQESVTVAGHSKTITQGQPLTSDFFVKWDFYKQTDYLFENVFFAKSAAAGNSLSYVLGRDGSGESRITFAKAAQTFTAGGGVIAPTTAGTASYDLSKGAYFRLLMHNDGLLEIYVINKELRCPVEHCEQKLLAAYQLTREDIEGYIELSAEGSVRIDGFTVGQRSIGVHSVIHGIEISSASFAGAKAGGEITLSAIFDITSPLAENMGLYWSVESGDAHIVGGNRLKIEGAGAITVRVVSVYDESVTATATIYVPEIQGISIDPDFNKSAGSTSTLRAYVDSKPAVEQFSAVKWQVIEGDADIDQSGKLKINGNGRITVKAISLFDPTVNAEYSFITGQSDSPAQEPSSCGAAGLPLAAALTAAVLVIAAAKASSKQK